MPTLLLDLPKLDDLDAPQLDERLDDSDNIFSITQEDVARLNASFYEFYSNRSAQSVAISGAALGVGGLIVAAGSASASPTGGGASNAAEAAAASIAAGVTNAINTNDRGDRRNRPCSIWRRFGADGFHGYFEGFKHGFKPCLMLSE